MEYVVFGWLFILGLIIGSFLNVVILRFDTEESIVKGRSKCPHCGKVLSWRELIPLVSFAVQRGRCVDCGSKISWQYPLVELATAMLIFFIFAKAENPWIFLLTVTIVCLYVIIFVYDLKHKIIPDLFSYSAALVALVIIISLGFSNGGFDFYKIIAGPILFVFFYLFWVVSKGRWMGLGDAKLALSLGWFLGLWQGIAAVLLSFWIGAIVSLIIMFFQKFMSREMSVSFTLKSQIPFGPFILIGFLLSFIFDIDIQSILSFLAV